MSAVVAALEIDVETIRLVISTTDEKADAYTLIDTAIRTHVVVASTGEARFACMRSVKDTNIMNDEERVAERLTYTKCFDTVSSEHGGNVVNGLMPALEDK
jgi:hypothetical protein